MADEDRPSEAGSQVGDLGQGEQGGDAVEEGSVSGAQSALKETRSPLFVAEHSERYERQRMIREYEALYRCRLIVMRDGIFPDSITYLEELLWDADPGADLHLILDSPGGDGEIAVRLARSAQSRCRELTVIVPDQAKSAGTVLVMGAHHILMGPTSDLGPVDPQFQVTQGGPLYAGRDIIAAVEFAQQSITEFPESYPLHAALLQDVTALLVQAAKSSIERTPDLVLAALKSNPDRSTKEAETILGKVQKPLIDDPREHGAVVGVDEASDLGLPIVKMDPRSDQWQRAWRLYAKYFLLNVGAYEGRTSSRLVPLS